MIKSNTKKNTKATINYYCPSTDIAEEKLQWLSNTSIDSIPFEKIKPDKHYNWLNITDNDFEELLPIIDKQVKNNKIEEAIFKLFSRGICTCRDEWVYDIDRSNLENKMMFFIDIYEKIRRDSSHKDKFSINGDTN